MAIMSYRGLLSSIVETEGHGHWTQGQAERTPVSTDLWLHHHRGSGCVHVPTPVLCLCSPFLCYGVHLCACSWHMHTDPPWLPTWRLTADSIDRCVPVCLSRWSCFRLLCFLYIVLCGRHSSVGRYGPHLIHDRPVCRPPVGSGTHSVACHHPVLLDPTQGGFIDLAA